MNSYKQKIIDDKILKKIAPYLKQYKAYLVGGFVRDIILGIESHDRDIIVENCNIQKLSKDISDSLSAHFVPMDTENNIYRIVLEDKINYFDLTVPIENDLIKDLLRRDLTINAIAFDINKGEFIDPAGGIKDIKDKLIRNISEQNIIDDPLRLLRIFRFHAKLGFNIDKRLIELAKKYAEKIDTPAKERINTELIKLFEGNFATSAIKLMDECNILERLLPFTKRLKQVPPNSHHHLNLFEHSLEVVRQIEQYYQNSSGEVRKYLDSVQFADIRQIGFLKLAGFCHDIGKPDTWTIEEDTGRHRFIKHDDVGSKLIVPVLKTLKFSKKQIAYIQTLIKNHIYPSTVVTQALHNEKAKMRFYRKLDNYVIDVIILAMADRLSAKGPDITTEIIDKNIKGLTRLVDAYIEQKDNLKPLPKLISGTDIMELLGINASKLLGRLIGILKEAQISGEVNTKEEAIDYIKQLDIEEIKKTLL